MFSPNILVGLLIGAAVVFLFSGLAINAVGRAAGAVVYEVRRQFQEIPGIMEGTGRPEYGKVVDICTRDSLRELATPGLLAILAPIAVGFGLGVGPLAGYLAGAIGTGTLMAIFLANSGGAWDNAKKLVEDGHHGGKGSPAHEATIIGDTVGDPFKDTAGPAINPLLKVMNLVSLLIAAAVVNMSVGSGENDVLRIVIARGGRRRSSRPRSTSPSVARSPSARRSRRASAPDPAPPRSSAIPPGLPERWSQTNRRLRWPTWTSSHPTSSTGSAPASRTPASGTTRWPVCSARPRTRPSRATRRRPACGPPPAAPRWRRWSGSGRSRRPCPVRPATARCPGWSSRCGRRACWTGPGTRCAPGSTYAPTPTRGAAGGWSAT